MTRYRKLFSAIAFCVFLSVPAALSAQNWQDNLKEAKQLYINKIYQNAQTLFQKASNQIREEEGTSSRAYEEAEGYRLLCAIKLGQKGAEARAGSYIRKFPSSPLVPKIRFEAASAYFAREDYGRALGLMEELKPSDIDKDDRDRYLLEKGVCLMKDFRTVEAQNHLMEIPQKSKLYGIPSMPALSSRMPRSSLTTIFILPTRSRTTPALWRSRASRATALCRPCTAKTRSSTIRGCRIRRSTTR